MAEAVSHKGLVISSDNKTVKVEIVSESACASCHAAGLCGASESKRKTIEVPLRGGRDYQSGQEVEVCLARKAGMKAVLLSYALPALILLILILSLSLIGLGELATGVFTISGVAVYYLVLYFFRDGLSEGYEFYIRER
ncbi:MAG: SoxR reducing system RseC family protein [Bacteroidales bacterium]|nr:SoxR reducing system RseC family protein [Bacteroidales bacterium]